MKIDEDLDTRTVRNRIGVGKNEELRTSSRRFNYLQKFARVITGSSGLKVSPNSQIPTARVNQESDNPFVEITTREFDQPVTNLPDDVFDMTFQEALLVHEVGHVLYTDQPKFKKTLSRVDLQYKRQFKTLWNVLEDGAIEKQLRNKFNVSNELFVLNANLLDQGGDKSDVDMDDEDAEMFGEAKELGVFQAIHLGLMDMTVYDSGNFAKLLDDDNSEFVFDTANVEHLIQQAIPYMESVAEDVLTQPDGARRTERIYKFWTDIKPLFEQSDSQQDQQGQQGRGGEADNNDEQGDDGQQQQDLGDLFGDPENQDGQDGDEQGDQGGQAAPVMGKPDDTENADMGEAQSADELDNDDNEEDVEDQIGQAQNSTDSEFDREQDGGDEQSGGSGGEEGDEDGDDSSPSQSDIEQEIEEDRRNEIRQEASEVEGSEAIEDEIEEYVSIMSAGGGKIDEIEHMLYVEEGDFDRGRWRQCEKDATQVKNVLEPRLKQERRARTVKNQRRGKFDSSRTLDAARGSPRVFEREKEGNEKEYEVVIVLDRSYSMQGQRMQAAEEAVATFAIALEDLGIKVSIVDMWNNTARLISPLDNNIRRDREKIMTNDCSGGTPLSDVISLTRERLGSSEDDPFMIVVTDGQPADVDDYQDELDKCTFPVLGLYINEAMSEEELDNLDHDEYFHRQQYTNDFSDLNDTITQLAREVMF